MNNDVRDPKAIAVTIIKRIGVPWWYMDYDDLISEGYLGYLAAQQSYDPDKCNFSSWAYLKMRGYIMNYLIRKSPKNHVDIDEIVNKLYTVDNDNIDFHRAVKKLPSRTQKILWLQYYAGLNHREIGKILGLAKSSISSIHVKALKELRTELL